MKPPEMIETTRLRLRRTALEDAEAIFTTYARDTEATEDCAEGLGYIVGREYWGRVYMTEVVRAISDWALAQPEVHRVWAVCDVDNLASARVMEKAGMVREGTLRRWAVPPNVDPATPRDFWCYARVKETP